VRERTKKVEFFSPPASHSFGTSLGEGGKDWFSARGTVFRDPSPCRAAFRSLLGKNADVPIYGALLLDEKGIWGYNKNG
jgi:hypothetical protein